MLLLVSARHHILDNEAAENQMRHSQLNGRRGQSFLLYRIGDGDRDTGRIQTLIVKHRLDSRWVISIFLSRQWRLHHNIADFYCQVWLRLAVSSLASLDFDSQKVECDFLYLVAGPYVQPEDQLICAGGSSRCATNRLGVAF